jgi:hypothetical protein
VQLVAVQGELEIALLQAALGIIRFPIAAIPELHGAAAILSLGNGAFEITVIERVILDLDREPLVMWIERRAFRHRPGLEHAVMLEPEIVMQTACIMLLDHEPPLLGRRHLDLAGGLAGFVEIALLAVGRQTSLQHGKPHANGDRRSRSSRFQEPKPLAAVEVP